MNLWDMVLGVHVTLTTAQGLDGLLVWLHNLEENIMAVTPHPKELKQKNAVQVFFKSVKFFKLIKFV